MYGYTIVKFYTFTLRLLNIPVNTDIYIIWNPTALIWPRGLRRRSAAARLLRMWVRIPPGAWMSVCCECCVLSGRGLCDEPITRPEESYRLCCVVVCDLETSRMRRPWPALGRSATGKKKIIFINCNWVVTRWQWLFLSCKQNMKLVTNKYKSGGLHEKHVVATWDLGNRLSVCF